MCLRDVHSGWIPQPPRRPTHDPASRQHLSSDQLPRFSDGGRPPSRHVWLEPRDSQYDRTANGSQQVSNTVWFVASSQQGGYSYYVMELRENCMSYIIWQCVTKKILKTSVVRLFQVLWAVFMSNIVWIDWKLVKLLLVPKVLCWAVAIKQWFVHYLLRDGSGIDCMNWDWWTWQIQLWNGKFATSN